MRNRLFAILTPLVVMFAFPALPAKPSDYSNVRVVALTFMQGRVQYQRPGEDWKDVALDLPIQEGFTLRTIGGVAEVKFEDFLVMRIGVNSTVEFSNLGLAGGGRITRLKISAGEAILDAKLGHADAVSVDAVDLNVKVPHDARFRMDVSPTESRVTVSHGRVEAGSGSRAPTSVNKGQVLVENANSFEITRSPAQDAFDKWVAKREDEMNAAQRETAHASDDTDDPPGLPSMAGPIDTSLGAGRLPRSPNQFPLP